MKSKTKSKVTGLLFRLCVKIRHLTELQKFKICSKGKGFFFAIQMLIIRNYDLQKHINTKCILLFE